MSLKKKILIAAAVIAVAVVVALAVIFFLGKSFVEQEGKVRTEWEVDAGALLDTDEETGVELRPLLRAGCSREELAGAMARAILDKPAAHCFETGAAPEHRNMSQIGG